MLRQSKSDSNHYFCKKSSIMRFKFLFLFFLFVNYTYSQKQNPSIGFIENKGQIVDQKGKENNSVLYLLNTPGLNVQLRNNGFSYDIYEAKKVPSTQKEKDIRDLSVTLNKENIAPDYSLKYNYHRIDIDFLNSNPNVKLVSEEKSTDYENYYNISHDSQGITGVHKYKKVIYNNIYNNIDAVFFIPKDTTKVVEYNFIVKPGGKISDIQLKFNGVKTELIDNKIKMNVRFGQMEETIPLSWIDNIDLKKEISVKYKKIKSNVYGFAGVENSSNKTIVIDPTPVRLWGTYYGGSGDEMPNDITSDTNNNIYISGTTNSQNNIATSGTHLSSTNSFAGFITKFDSNGVRIWGTYYLANVLRIKVDNNFNIFSTGNAINSLSISSPNSYQEFNNGFNDAYLIKLNINGLREWATYYGGEGNDYGRDITFDNNNNVYLCGETTSYNSISTPNSAKQRSHTIKWRIRCIYCKI